MSKVSAFHHSSNECGIKDWRLLIVIEQKPVSNKATRGSLLKLKDELSADEITTNYQGFMYCISIYLCCIENIFI